MSSLRDRWHEFAAAEPGTRFELEYQRKRGLDQPAWKRVLGVLGGVALIDELADQRYRQAIASIGGQRNRLKD